MAKDPQKTELPSAYVYWTGHPTEMDDEGVGGMYIERVELKPFRVWPFTSKVRWVANFCFGFMRMLLRWLGCHMPGIRRVDHG